VSLDSLTERRLLSERHLQFGARSGTPIAMQGGAMVVDATQRSWMEARSCQLDGIRVTETIISAGATLPDHAHDTGQLCFVLEGEMRERTLGWDDCYPPGAFRSHGPGFRHMVKVSPDSDVLVLLLFIDRDRWIKATPNQWRTADTPLRNYGAQIRRELVRLDDASRTALEGWCMLALSAAARGQAVAPAPPPRWLSDAVSMIERRATEGISLGTLADALGVHRATLAAAFRRFRRTSVGESIREVRVRKVMRALVASKMPLCEIATTCGFHDQAHMGRVFRKAIGFSPGGYRNLRR
jgi:AraC family transcriptional regulator